MFFSFQEIHVHDFGGRAVIAAFVLNSLTGFVFLFTLFLLFKIISCLIIVKISISYFSRAIALWFIVCRTKQCLDFAATAHFLHLVICWHYNSHFPASLSWWLLNAACVTIMCVYGEYLCLRTELQAIPLSVGPKADL